MSDIENCDTCGPHLDRLRTELLSLMTAVIAVPSTPKELVDMLMCYIAPRMHAAVEDAEGAACAVVPEQMV